MLKDDVVFVCIERSSRLTRIPNERVRDDRLVCTGIERRKVITVPADVFDLRDLLEVPQGNRVRVVGELEGRVRRVVVQLSARPNRIGQADAGKTTIEGVDSVAGVPQIDITRREVRRGIRA